MYVLITYWESAHVWLHYFQFKCSPDADCHFHKKLVFKTFRGFFRRKKLPGLVIEPQRIGQWIHEDRQDSICIQHKGFFIACFLTGSFINLVSTHLIIVPGTLLLLPSKSLSNVAAIIHALADHIITTMGCSTSLFCY